MPSNSAKAVVRDRDRALLARVGPNGVPPEVARRRLRVGFAVLAVATAAGIAVPAMLERFGVIRSGAALSAAFVGLVAALAVEFTAMGGRPVCHGPDRRYVTARTLTGARTVDVAALARIRRVRIPSKTGWLDQLWITDRRGVQLLVDDGGVVRRVAQAVAADSAGAVKVSPHAATLLGRRRPSTALRAARAGADILLGLYLPLAAAGIAILVSRLITTI